MFDRAELYILFFGIAIGAYAPLPPMPLWAQAGGMFLSFLVVVKLIQRCAKSTVPYNDRRGKRRKSWWGNHVEAVTKAVRNWCGRATESGADVRV
jgi:membrane protein implicated in regulation of membrane protease activity